MAKLEHVDSSFAQYSLSLPGQNTGRTIFFVPGIASNRFGHPVYFGPRGAVKDLVDDAENDYTIIFPEIHMTNQASANDLINGLTVEEQSERALAVLSHVSKYTELGEVTYIGQSLGSLAVAQLVQHVPEVESQNAILWGPPTLEGEEHREMLVSKFLEGTLVDKEGRGVLKFAGGKSMYVSPKFWRSMDENSLRAHYENMFAATNDIAAIYASRDDYYPNVTEYLATHTPKIKKHEIPGTSHTFRDADMRSGLRGIMLRLLNEVTMVENSSK